MQLCIRQQRTMHHATMHDASVRDSVMHDTTICDILLTRNRGVHACSGRT